MFVQVLNLKIVKIKNLLAQEGSAGELLTDQDYYREYNALHQLIRVRKGNTSTGAIVEEYWYNPNGERVKTVRTESGKNTTIYTPFREWMQIRNSTGVYDFTYIYDGNTLIARKNPDNTTWFYHDDHLGSTSLITDESGNIVEETFYTPFGQITEGGESEAYLLYTNQFKDAVGCYDYGARVYCPNWYHFTSSDPITANVFEPQKLNKYSYVANNPYVFIDPTGKKIKKFGASKGYSKAGTAAASKSAYQAAHGGAGGPSQVYQVSYETDDGRKRSIIMEAKEYETVLKAAQYYAENSIYAKYFTDDRDIVQEIVVEYIEQTYYNTAYEPRSYNQILAQSNIGQSAISIGASVLTSEVGGIGGGVVTTYFRNADIQELKARGIDPTLGDYMWAFGDTAASVLGGPVVKSSAKAVGLEVTESVTTNLVAETTGTALYETGKYTYLCYANGDENG